MSLRTIDVSNPRLTLYFAAEDNRLRWASLAPAGGSAWINADTPSSLFSLTVDGQVWEAPALTLTGVDEDEPAAGVRHAAFHLSGPGFSVTAHVKTYAEGAVLETWQDVRNDGPAPREQDDHADDGAHHDEQ